jgi:hypothetical protein
MDSGANQKGWMLFTMWVLRQSVNHPIQNHRTAPHSREKEQHHNDTSLSELPCDIITDTTGMAKRLVKAEQPTEHEESHHAQGNGGTEQDDEYGSKEHVR